MVAKIGRGKSLIGALSYNMDKVRNSTATVLAGQKIIESPEGTYTLAQISKSFQVYLAANRKTEKPIVHISLNPDPDDKVTDNNYIAIAKDYMNEMGYGKQPFIIFKHSDIERSHIHIVTVCVDDQGRKISDTFEKRRSMATCRELERLYKLKNAVEKKQKLANPIFRPVSYKAGDSKSQMATVLRYLPKYYQYSTLGAYNALLSLYNMTSEEVKGLYNGSTRQGLIYFALNENGEKASNPFKASLFGKAAGYSQLQLHLNNCKEQMKISPIKSNLTNTIQKAIQAANNENEFKENLNVSGIITVVRRTADERIYGITFIHHTSGTVWNGSQLGKNISAGVFNDWWNKGLKPEFKLQIPLAEGSSESATINIFPENAESAEIDSPSISSAMDTLEEMFGGWLPQAAGDNYEEESFAWRMKKRSKKRKR